MELQNAMQASTSGLNAQSQRLRIIAENIANAESLSTIKGGDPYRRKVVIFNDELNRKTGVEEVKIKAVRKDTGDFKKEYDPNHPAADEKGYVKMPNVNRFIEMMDMKEAQRSYEANLQAIDVSRTMLRDTIRLIGN
jgi:flagellar basal-body rod protein FlgC